MQAGLNRVDYTASLFPTQLPFRFRPRQALRADVRPADPRNRLPAVLVGVFREGLAPVYRARAVAGVAAMPRPWDRREG